MMRCVCCNRNLNDYESTLKIKSTGEYADTCNKCRVQIGNDVGWVARSDLEPFTITPDDEIDYETWNSDDA